MHPSGESHFHAGEVAYVDFKLRCSQADGNKLRLLKIPVVKQKSFELGPKVQDFSTPTRKGGQWTIPLCVGGKN